MKRYHEMETMGIKTEQTNDREGKKVDYMVAKEKKMLKKSAKS